MSEAGKEPLASTSSSSSQSPLISLEEFQKVALRVGVVVSAHDHPNADRLLVLSVDLGEGTPRQLVAGIKGPYQASDVVGKHIVVVANLKPAAIRGVESQGMLLASHDGSQLAILTLDRSVQAGSPVK